MAAPAKKTVDYFPFNVKDGKTLFILESKYQCKGTGFFTNMMRFLCLQPDHHYRIADEADSIWFFSKTHCDEESGRDMLSLMAKTGKIDSDLWNNHRVIVCADLIESIKDAYRHRNTEIITMDEIRVSYVDNPVSNVINPQSKVNKTKVKEIYSVDFLSFWKNYPNKTGKKEAWKAWEKARDKPSLDNIIAALISQKCSEKWTKDGGQYIPNPATWLNRGSWDDQLPVGKNTGGNYGRTERNFRDRNGSALPPDVEREADAISAEYYARQAAKAAASGDASGVAVNDDAPHFQG